MELATVLTLTEKQMAWERAAKERAARIEAAWERAAQISPVPSSLSRVDLPGKPNQLITSSEWFNADNEGKPVGAGIGGLVNYRRSILSKAVLIPAATDKPVRIRRKCNSCGKRRMVSPLTGDCKECETNHAQHRQSA